MINLLVVLPGGAEQSGDVVLPRRERRAASGSGFGGSMRCRRSSPNCTPSAPCSSKPSRSSAAAGSRALGSLWTWAAGPGRSPRRTMRLTTDHPVTGACLVGAVVQAGGGPEAVRSQPVQRTLDLIWHSLREDAVRPVRWCPGPPVRAIHVLDLTHWNDAPDRTRGEVVELLRSSVAAADDQRERCRSEQAVLAGPPSSGSLVLDHDRTLVAQASDRNITCRPTYPCSGERKAPGTVPTISKPRSCHRRTAATLVSTTALNWMPR